MTHITIYSLWLTAFLTAVIHTVTGPDHYLPFIAIAKARNYSLKKTLLWTFICGIGHIGSALLIALGFVYLSHFLNQEQLVGRTSLGCGGLGFDCTGCGLYNFCLATQVATQITRSAQSSSP